MTVELHAAPTGNSIRAAIALEEAGIPYVTYWVDLSRNQQRSPAHLSLNPAGKVPTLVERHPDGPTFVLSQSNAIVLYAASKAPGHLLPRHDGAERALAFERFFYFVTDVIAPSHAGFLLKRCDSAAGADLLHARACEAVELAETFLAETPFMAGRAFTVADIAAVTIVAHLEPSLAWKRLPNLRKWLDAIRSRPAVDRGFRAFDRFRDDG